MTLTETGPMQTAHQRYLDATPKSRALAEQARGLLPNGVSRSGIAFSHYPLFIDRAEGKYLYDVDGRAILDLSNANSALLLGHAHPHVVGALQAQLARGLSFGWMHESELRLAGLLQERLPSMERMRFTSSGSEATTFAVRLARAYSGRMRIARMEGSYHGTQDSMATGPGPFLARSQPGTEDAPVSMGVPRWVAKDFAFLPFNDLETCTRMIEAQAGELGAVIVEPVLGSGGALPPEPGFLEGLRALCDRFGLVLIFDEMISMGMSPGGAQAYYGVRPDLTATGKVVGGGMPMGCFGGKAEIMALCEPRDGKAVVAHTGTFCAHPLAMTAGAAQLEQLTPAVYAHINELSAYLRKGTLALAARRGVALQVTGVAHITGLHYIDRPVRGYWDARAADAKLAWEVGLSLLSQGFHLAGGARIYPSAPMTTADIDRLLAAMEVAFEEAGAVGC